MELGSRVLEFIRTGAAGASGDAEFAALALEGFRHQWEANAAYRGLLERRGIDPGRVTRWEEIPAVSTVAFKRLRLACGPTRLVFRTSGTTHAGALRGEHHLADTELYEAALRRHFEERVLPDRGRIRFISLTPSPAWLPDSSLGFMLADLHRTFGTPSSGFYLGPDGLDEAGLLLALGEAERAGEPVLLAGVALAFLSLLERLAETGRRYRLAPGSRVMDTGGFKGSRRTVGRAELLEGYAERFGIPADHVINEYGMTELGSQFYDAALSGGDPEVKLAPPWVRTLVIDPESGVPAAAGQPGLLRHIDLANLESVLAVETEDLGATRGEGFVLLGRAAGAEPRGCSLVIDSGPRS